MNQSQQIMETLGAVSEGGAVSEDTVVLVKKGDGFWFAVPKDDPSKTVMRARTESSLRKKLVKARKFIIVSEAAGGLFEGKAEDFAKKAASQASKVKVRTAKGGRFTKAEAKGNRLTLGLTSQVDLVVEFREDDDMPGGVVVSSARAGMNMPKLDQFVNQKQFKKPMDFLNAVVKAID